MKLACSSTAFDALLRSGELTQLEWIDLCAHELAADGIVLDVRHFPRADTDYLAQVKKMAADLGLTVVAVRHDALFELDRERAAHGVEMALELGAPLLCAPLPPETSCGWSEIQARLGVATGLAKQHNVTLAVRNAPGTFGATVHDMKRVSKEADSAWLRFGPDFAALDAASEPRDLLPKTVLAWYGVSESDPAAAVSLLAGFLGFVALDAEGNAGVEETKSALRRWRGALFAVADRI